MARHSEFGRRVREGRELKAARDGQPYTQLDLANDLAKSRNAIDAWENGRAYPPPHTRARIAEALGASLKWLEGKGDEPYPNGKPVVSASPIASAMGAPTVELSFTSTPAAQRARVWLEQLLLELAEKGADEEFLTWSRRMLLAPANYALSAMDDEQKLRHMQGLADGVRSVLRARVGRIKTPPPPLPMKPVATKKAPQTRKAP